MKQLLFVAAIAATFTACQVKYEKTKSGFLYKITKGKGGEKLKGGDFVKFDISFKVRLAGKDKDSTLSSTFGKIPGYAMVDTSSRATFTFMEVLPKCSVGDSISFNLSIDSLKKLGAIPEYNNVFTKGGMINGAVKVLARFKSEAETTDDYKKEVDVEKDREVAALQAYLDKQGLKAQKTKSGAFVVLDVPGDAPKADSGKQAMVMYRGTLQADGKQFDTNMDSSSHHTDPLPVVVGTGSVIKGWDEALPYFGKGGKGKIYIPAMLAYGPQGNPSIPAFSNLVFEVEIKDVKDAPAPQAAPAMPGMQGADPHGAH